MKNILCFLSVRPCEKFLNYWSSLKTPDYDVCVVVDDNTYTIPTYESKKKIKIIRIDNKICEDAGFKSTVTPCKNRACSRDKALFYFSANIIDYEYIWFIEEDVFIPELNAIINIDKKYKKCDLLSTSNRICYNENDSLSWPHWNRVLEECTLPLPFIISMICAIRCSKKMLECIKDYACNHKTLFFCEILFNTIAYHNKLIVETPIELSKIHWIKTWDKKDVCKNMLLHPIKEIDTQNEFREYLYM